MELVLAFVPETSAYTGTLDFRGSRYPAQGRVQRAVLQGTFRVGGEQFAFTARRRGDLLTLTSDGTDHELTVRRDAAPVGGVGISFQQRADQNWIVQEVLPGSPAAEGGVPRGAVLRAVDGMNVKGENMDRVRSRVTGPAGTTVTLTLETDGKIAEVVLIRASLGTPAASSVPGLPSWLKPGTRITYWGGSRSVPGTSQNYIPDPNGGFSIGGKRHRLEDVEGSGGSGYSQYDVVHVGRTSVGISMNNYVPTDTGLTTLVRTHSQGLQGDHGQIGDFWINPARLRAMPEEDTQTSIVRRVRYPLEGRVYDALATQTRSSTAYIRNTYDLATGLLLVHTSSTTGKGGLTPMGGNKVGVAEGVTTIVSSRLVAIREMKLPWSGQDLPDWLTPGRMLRYTGTITNSLGIGLVAPWRYDMDIGVQSRIEGFVTAELTTRLDYGYGAGPQVSTSVQVYGAGMFGPLWIAPEALRQLKEGTELDLDPVTRRQFRFLGSDGASATLLEEGPLDAIQYTYDLQSGVLAGAAVRMRQGAATLTYKVQLAERR